MFLTWGGFLGCSADPITYGLCKEDHPCAQGWFCTQGGECYRLPEICLEQGECPEGACHDGVCTSHCDDNDGCTSKHVCKDGVCLWRCERNEQCPAGLICNVTLDGATGDGQCLKADQ